MLSLLLFYMCTSEKDWFHMLLQFLKKQNCGFSGLLWLMNPEVLP